MNKTVVPVIKTTGISKSFGPTKAVVAVKLEVPRGEVRGLIGENGSGKSTLAAILAGVIQPDCGAMVLNGEAYSPDSALEGKRAKVCLIVQETGTIDGLSVAENVFLGIEDRFSKFGHVNKKKMLAQTAGILKKIGADCIQPERPIQMYSFEDRKLIEVAMAMHEDPELLILDETTTALSQKGREIVYAMIGDRKRQGKTVIVISHDMAEMESLCDSITVMRDGELIKTLEKPDIDQAVMRRLMIGRDLQGHYYRADASPSCLEEAALSVNHVSLRRKARVIGQSLTMGGALNDISFTLKNGEILGIGGLTECGMHDLCKILFGIVKPDSGFVEALPQKRKIKSAEDALACKIGYLPKDRESEGLMTLAGIQDNIVLMSLDKLKTGFWIHKKGEKSLAAEMARLLNIKYASISQACAQLSGGNKQKVNIAKWLANDTDIFIMDCPTRGIDLGVKAAIYALMNKIKQEGKSIVMVSEELPELIGMADRILILKNGGIAGTFMRSETLGEAELIEKMI